MSSIIKSPFVSFAEQKKKIEVVSNTDVKIINNYSNRVQNDVEAQECLSGLFIETEIAASSESLNQKQQAILDSAYEDLIIRANQEAQAIIQSAKDEALQIEKEAKVRGHKEGLKAGKEEGMSQVVQLKQDLEEDIESIEEEKRAFYRGIEPKVAEIIKTLVSNMVDIQKFDKETILFVIRKGLEEVDVQGDLVIKVSPEDFDEVMQHKHLIEGNMSSQLHLEVLKDAKMSRNDCIIETNLGNINCGLNERMSGLIKQLSLIQKSFGSR